MNANLIVGLVGQGRGRGRGARAVDIEERPELVLVVLPEAEIVLVFLEPPEMKMDIA